MGHFSGSSEGAGSGLIIIILLSFLVRAQVESQVGHRSCFVKTEQWVSPSIPGQQDYIPTAFPQRNQRSQRGDPWLDIKVRAADINSARDVRVKQSSGPPISQQFLTNYLLEMRGEQHFLCFQVCVREPWWRLCRTPTLIQIENVNFLPLSTPSRLHWLPWPGGKECKINLLADDGGMALLGRLNGNSWLTGENGDQEDRTEFQGWLATLPWWSI